MSMNNFIVLKVSNQRHYYYIKVNDETFIGDFWIKISKYGYFKLEGFYRFDMSNKDSKDMFTMCIVSSASYYDSFESFARNRKKVA